MSVTAPLLEPFITPDELRVAISDPDLPDDQAAWLCDWGSAAVRAEVGQTVTWDTPDGQLQAEVVAIQPPD